MTSEAAKVVFNARDKKFYIEHGIGELMGPFDSEHDADQWCVGMNNGTASPDEVHDAITAPIEVGEAIDILSAVDFDWNEVQATLASKLLRDNPKLSEADSLAVAHTVMRLSALSVESGAEVDDSTMANCILNLLSFLEVQAMYRTVNLDTSATFLSKFVNPDIMSALDRTLQQSLNIPETDDPPKAND